MHLSLGASYRKLRRAVRNVVFDLRYGGLAGGYIRNRYPGATGVASTDYALMPQIFGGRIRPDDVLVEVGCGKGRVINWWLSQGLRNRMVGLEIMEDVAAATRARLRRFANVEIVAGDVLANIPRDGTLFYLFNPFDEATMARFKDTLASASGRLSELRIIYYACVHLNVFHADDRWLVEEFEVKPAGAGRFEERHSRLAAIRPRGGSSPG